LWRSPCRQEQRRRRQTNQAGFCVSDFQKQDAAVPLCKSREKGGSSSLLRSNRLLIDNLRTTASAIYDMHFYRASAGRVDNPGARMLTFTIGEWIADAIVRFAGTAVPPVRTWQSVPATIHSRGKLRQHGSRTIKTNREGGKVRQSPNPEIAVHGPRRFRIARIL